MLRVNGAYLYELGPELRAIETLPDEDATILDTFFVLNGARVALQNFTYASIFSDSVRVSSQAAAPLLDLLNDSAPDLSGPIEWETEIPRWKLYQIKLAFRKFETIMLAELQASALYLVSAKGGFDTVKLTDYGEELFPSALSVKAPGALVDVRAGARCLAFELPTAAAFHFHRANEAVLRVYFDAVAGAKNRPRTRNMGDYLKKMEALEVGDPKVIGVLKSLKDLHRNPLMHPDDIISSNDEALSLYSAIRAAIGYMLDRIDPVPAIARS